MQEEKEEGRCSRVDEGRSERQEEERELAGVKEEESRVGEQRFMWGEGCSEGAEGNSQAYYRWGSPGRAQPRVFQASPAYFTAVPSSTLQSPQPSKDK